MAAMEPKIRAFLAKVQKREAEASLQLSTDMQ